MAPRLPALLLALIAGSTFLGMLLGSGLGEWLFALGVMAFPSALLALAARGPRARRAWLGAGLLALLLCSCAAGILALRGAVGAHFLGMPLPMLLFLGGLWLAPFPFTVVAFQASFDEREG
jgi:hypothetical protein